MAEPTRRHRQVANAVRQELVGILHKDISDPRLEAAGMITVSGLDIAEDMRNATVWLAFMGKEKASPEVKGALEALRSAEKFIHRLLIKRIPMKVHPHLTFRFDEIFDRATTVSKALEEAAQVEKETAEFRANQDEPPENQEEE